jgi:hypothetical protein|tara:strand:- start:304 stop:450 length:147 start_codon:yes stop_codon:yes gene_type:complete
MPYLNPPQVFYEGLNDKKYDGIKAEMLKLYVLNLEGKVYPVSKVYPEK